MREIGIDHVLMGGVRIVVGKVVCSGAGENERKPVEVGIDGRRVSKMSDKGKVKEREVLPVVRSRSVGVV